MKLTVVKLRSANFGDDLNRWMWPRLLPGVFDDDESIQFLGIGSIISSRYDGPSRKVVCGAGYVADYDSQPDLGGDRWRFYFVRGPRTAATLGLDPKLAVGDAAILIRALIPPGAPANGDVAFMPHWESLDWGYWPAACARAGVRLIDPRGSVEVVIEEIRRARLMICEAMHGAIVADALRIPWIPMLPLDPRHRAKWGDWGGALGLRIAPRLLLPSSLTELAPRFTLRPPLLRTVRRVLDSWPMTPARAVTIRLAADCLARAAQAPGQLSEDHRIEAATERMLEALDRFRRDWREGRL